MSRIPIVATGTASAAGAGVDQSYAAVAEGRDGLTPLSVIDSGAKEPPLVAQITWDMAGLLESDTPNRTLACGLIAARQACCGVTERGELSLGLVFATTVAGMTRSERFFQNVLHDPATISRAAEELAYHEPTALAGTIARQIGADQVHSLSTACSTGLHAVGMAMRLIEQERVDLCLALGADALSVLTVRGFGSLVLLAPEGCRPFDRNRAGISLGEGAGALLLASPRAAETLGLDVLACADGWGASADCHHMTAPHPKGAGAIAAIEGALADAGIGADRVDFIAAHGTGTPDNDVSEVAAFQKVFDNLPPFFSMKRTLGHTLAASGSLEAAFAIEAMRRGQIPRSGGFEQLDETIGVAPSAGADMQAGCFIKTAFGFGGNNAAMVFSKAQTSEKDS